MDYKRPGILFNKHLETIYPALFRKVQPIPFHHERIETPDDDFLDLYWSTQGSEQLVIISHGLEGNVLRPYMLGMARALFLNGSDVVTWNYRGCGEEMNRRLCFYHSGATDDLHEVVKHAAGKGYRNINLVGFSLGGNITLKYLGEGRPDPVAIRRAVAFSVPMDLHTSCQKISRSQNAIYSRRFLRSLKGKILSKSRLMPGLDISHLEDLRTLIDFDDRYTAPLHGFKDALHYYESCSALRFLDNIKTPSLVVNAKNDPFLSEACFPTLKGHPFLSLETPQQGGHAGFTQFTKNGLYWSEERAVKFINTIA
ncbi:MAG TPA: alpha/beta fold hydrolase [Cyclobacteriaceae bacterium]|nr:alpha/beta fold hydrolase [Cyclobacteriaceae bacterium]